MFEQVQSRLSRFFGRGQQAQEPEEPPAPPDPEPEPTQITLSDREQTAILRYCNDAYLQALTEHNIRLAKCAEQTKSWREKEGLPGGAQGKSNLQVPIVKALIFAKHAREVEALFGGGAKIEATPRGPSDRGIAEKVGLAMSWRVFEQMRAVKPLALLALKRLIHGRSFAYVPPETKYYDRFANGKNERVKYSSGVGIYVLEPDDIVLPAEEFDSVQEAEWAMRRYRTRPTEMLLGEREGDRYQNIADNWKDIVKLSRQGLDRDAERDQSKIEKDASENVQRDHALSVKEGLEVREFYIRWRLEVAGPETDDEGMEEEGPSGQAGFAEGEADLPDYKPEADGNSFVDQDGVRREMLETQLVIRIQPELGDNGMIIGCQRLAQLFPDTPNKIPIMEMALLNDGQYWCQSLIEMTEEIEAEITRLVNLAIESGEFTVGPLILADASVGDTLETIKYEPKMIVRVANAAGVKVVNVSSDLTATTMLLQYLQGIYEQVSGITNFTMGRSMDQPQAPRTLGGTRLIMGAGDTRLALDMTMFSEDLRRLLDWIWALWTMFGSKEEFFRVSEGDGKRFFKPEEMNNGWVKLGAKEREGRYDFSLKFADDASMREARKQEALMLAEILLKFPIVMNDPVAQYNLAVEMCKALNFDFTRITSQPPPIFSPLTPEEEWTRALQGDDIHVHPLDNDQAHIADHEERLVAMMKLAPEDQDADAIQRMMDHIPEHETAMMQKRQAQMVMEGLRGMMNQINPEQPGAGIDLPPGAMGGGAPADGQQPAA